MDFLDPKKSARDTALLLVGYITVGVAIAIATVILLYQAYGFGIGKDGKVIQNGLLFLSSQPNPANVYLNGKLNKNQTNARLELPEGIYSVKLTRTGYRPWSRTIEVDGGTVEHFDYPLLFPQKLVTSKLQTYTSAPAFATQSLDRRWLLVEQPGSMTTFDEYDLQGATKQNPPKAPTQITLPSTLLSKATSSESWQLVGWSADNNYVLLDHIYDGKSEYILVDRANPNQSVNLTQTFSNTPFTSMTLNNEAYNQYYLYNSTNDTLYTANLSSPTPTPVLTHVLSYQTYGTNTILYATDSGAPTGKVNIDEMVGTQNYVIRNFAAGSTYLLDLTTYNNVPYVAVGAESDNKVYVYKNPISQLTANPKHVPVPAQVLFVKSPTYLNFSANAQFIMAEGGQQFGVYDIENARGYNYTTTLPLDSPQTHATWMDGDRLTYISGGKVVVFDYDHTNQQILMPANAGYLPFFGQNYNYVYTLAPVNGTTNTALTQTSLLIPADQ